MQLEKWINLIIVIYIMPIHIYLVCWRRFDLSRNCMEIKLENCIIAFLTTWLNLHWTILIGEDMSYCDLILKLWIKNVLKNEFSLCSKVTVSLRYADLISVFPTRTRVLAWPMHQSKKDTPAMTKEDGLPGINSTVRLTYAEDALRTMSLPEGNLI